MIVLSVSFKLPASVVGVLLYAASSAYGSILFFQPDEPIEVRRQIPEFPTDEEESSEFVHLDLTGNGQVNLVFGNFLRRSTPTMWPSTTIATFDVASNGSVRIGSFTNIFEQGFAVPTPAGVSIGGSENTITWTDDPANFFRYEQTFAGVLVSERATGQLERIRPLQSPEDFWDGPTYQGMPGYFALELAIDDQVFYGWMEVDTSFDGFIPDGGAITRWAYNSIPGEPIQAGQVPEPATVALLSGLAALVLTRFVKWRIGARPVPSRC